jgi:hypothetical protein
MAADLSGERLAIRQLLRGYENRSLQLRACGATRCIFRALALRVKTSTAKELLVYLVVAKNRRYVNVDSYEMARAEKRCRRADEQHQDCPEFWPVHEGAC